MAMPDVMVLTLHYYFVEWPMNTFRVIANRYEVLEPLGRGGFGSVFKVKDLDTGEMLALKYLVGDESRPLDTRRFQREFQHLSRLDHPHIVKVKDTGTDGTACFFTMEYLQGVTLEEALKAPDTGLYRVLQNGSDVFREILIQICEALACIHANGLVHRDLKPANIFLQSDQNGPHVKILDLGMVKFRGDDISPLTEEGTMLGTVHYMSPEQIRGVHVDHRSDLYTLGVVLYEVLTGQKPFLGKNSSAVVLKHLNEIPVPPRVYNLDVPHDLQLVVLKLLEKEPERRYRLANDLLADLVPSKSYAGRGISEPEPPLLLQHPRFLGRSQEVGQARGLLADVANFEENRLSGFKSRRFVYCTVAAIERPIASYTIDALS
jgi:serine/threonine protein kinase